MNITNEKTAMQMMIDDLQETIKETEIVLSETNVNKEKKRLIALKELLLTHIDTANLLLEVENKQVSELMNEVETKLKEPNFYIVNSKKYLTDEQRISVAEKIAQMSTTTTK